NLAASTLWRKIHTIALCIWYCCFVIWFWRFARRYRDGFEVAITADGLIFRLPGFKCDVIPWANISGASVEETPWDEPQIASVMLDNPKKKVEVGGRCNVFSTRSDVERFVRKVNERIQPKAADSRCGAGSGATDAK
ncbi:MAG: hypothetical protein O7F76_06055, partial [Planctomycetota bacterium]|nr:hypothetical protein [Planctomycetota bacterium]